MPAHNDLPPLFDLLHHLLMKLLGRAAGGRHARQGRRCLFAVRYLSAAMVKDRFMDKEEPFPNHLS